ncbi:ankyrin repeat-containing domain protein [Rhexocercosporidium sp. MPI-PUGE-AT-0058]|nr:ankyrin repeat-containing domain protein [Rhexocercosporidium sp. MPI-PUGE-AT-0058]
MPLHVEENPFLENQEAFKATVPIVAAISTAKSFVNFSSKTMERRKVQNREAQRRYRENIKRRLKMAERQLETRQTSENVLSSLDITCAYGNHDAEDGVDMTCHVGDALVALECSSPTNYDWTSIGSPCRVQSGLALLSPLETILDLPPVIPTSGSTVMHIAAEKGYYTIVRILSESGVDISAKDGSGQTPLHLAAAQGHSTTIIALLEAGAEVEAKNIQGHTPLFEAVSRGHETSVKTLLENGADANARVAVAVLEVEER